MRYIPAADEGARVRHEVGVDAGLPRPLPVRLPPKQPLEINGVIIPKAVVAASAGALHQREPTMLRISVYGPEYCKA